MNLRLVRFVFIFAVGTAIGMGFGLHPAMAEQEESGEEGGVQVLSHGPIHEAFAETVAFDPQPGAMVPKEPPPSIEEVPPEQKPEGDVQWVPGYWAWDDERNDFIWISGVWRIPPPGRQWVPGYWARSSQGFRWTSGYWVTIKASEAEYLPEPPDTVELGPNTNAPSSDYSWIPGCWIWHHGRYAWRPGYWAKMQSDWVWVPAHYSWTPRGYIFVSGYWDFVVGNRGVLYAPVYVAPNVYAGVAFSFSPGFVVDLNVFSDCLFLRPGYRHYYFGDYYAPRYYREGIYPWFSPHARRFGYDPIFAHQRWHHRHDNDWENHLNTRFRERRENESARPSRRPDFGRGQTRDGDNSSRASNMTTARFSPVRRSIDSSVRLKPVDEKERREIHQNQKAVRTYRKDRQERETQGISKPVNRSFGPVETSPTAESKRTVGSKRTVETSRPAGPSRTSETSRTFGPSRTTETNRAVETSQAVEAGRPAEPNRVKFGRSPITAKPVDQMAPENAPPSRYKPPKPDPNVEPLGRTSDAARTLGRGSSSSEVRGQSSAAGAPSSSARNKGQATSGRRAASERR